jgi:hypothetical protein
MIWDCTPENTPLAAKLLFELLTELGVTELAP